MDDPLDIDDQLSLTQCHSAEPDLGSLGKLELDQFRKEVDTSPRSEVDYPALFGWRPMKGQSRRIVKNNPMPEPEREVGGAMTFERWAKQRRQQGYPVRPSKS